MVAYYFRNNRGGAPVVTPDALEVLGRQLRERHGLAGDARIRVVVKGSTVRFESEEG